MENLTEYVDGLPAEKRLFTLVLLLALFFLLHGNKCDDMDILMIVLSLIAAYVLFVSVCYLLIRLLFPKIEVEDSNEVLPVKHRVHRYAARTVRKQKNLAY